MRVSTPPLSTPPLSTRSRCCHCTLVDSQAATSKYVSPAARMARGSSGPETDSTCATGKRSLTSLHISNPRSSSCHVVVLSTPRST